MGKLFFGISFLLICLTSSRSIYPIHITTIDGQDRLMGEFLGKNILIIVIPVTKTPANSAFLRKLDSIGKDYDQRLMVIGVPSVEDGYDSTNLINLRKYYQSLMGNEIIITKGMYTRKGSGPLQHKLFYWLTHSDKNEHFDEDITGIGHKFFVSSRGELYGESESSVPLNRSLLDRMMGLNQ